MSASARGLVEVPNAAEIRNAIARTRNAAIGAPDDLETLLPPGFVAASLSGGDGTLGFTADGTWLVPAVCCGTFGDLVVKKIRATPELALPEPFVLEALRQLVPRCAKSVERLEDPELVRRLFALAVEQARALCTFAYAGDARWADSRNAAGLEVLCTELLRISVQDLGLGSARAIDALKTGFTAPIIRGMKGPGSQRIPLFGSGYTGPASLAPSPLDRLELGAIGGMMELPEETFFAGKTAARLAKELASERRAATQSIAAEDAEQKRLAVLRKVTPREVGLIFVYRVVGSTIASAAELYAGPRQTEIRAGREWAAFRRDAFPVEGCTLPSVIAEEKNHAPGGRGEVWTTCADDERIEVTEGLIEAGARRTPPAYVLTAVAQGVVAAKAPTAAAPPKLLDLRQRETPRRVKLLRAHLERISASMLHAGASSFIGERSAPLYITLACQLGVARLSLSPLLVGAEIDAFAKAKMWPWVPSMSELIARAADVAKHPATQLYAPLPEAKS